MTYTIQNLKNIQGRNNRGIYCNDSESDKTHYFFHFHDRSLDKSFGIEIQRKVTDDGFLKYIIYNHFGSWNKIHTAMIRLDSIETPDDAMDMFTQLLDTYKYIN